MKFTFASGLIEIINEVPDAMEGETLGSGLEPHRNFIAILPFGCLIDKQLGITCKCAELNFNPGFSELIRVHNFLRYQFLFSENGVL